jgi:hypothetical protein
MAFNQLSQAGFRNVHNITAGIPGIARTCWTDPKYMRFANNEPQEKAK